MTRLQLKVFARSHQAPQRQASARYAENVLIGSLFLEDRDRAAADPGVDLLAQSQHHAASLAPGAPDGEIQVVFPSLDRSHPPVEVSGNFFPGIESIASWESVSRLVDHANPHLDLPTSSEFRR